MPKITIHTESLLTHDYRRASVDYRLSQWEHLVVLDCRDFSVDVETLFGGGTPVSIHECRSYVLCHVGDGTADATDLVECLSSETTRDTLSAIVAAYSESWDGSCYYGQLSETARELLHELQTRLERTCENLPRYWDVEEWYESVPTREVASIAMDEDREERVEQILLDAQMDGAHLDRQQLINYLDRVRREAILCTCCGVYGDRDDFAPNGQCWTCADKSED